MKSYRNENKSTIIHHPRPYSNNSYKRALYSGHDRDIDKIENDLEEAINNTLNNLSQKESELSKKVSPILNPEDRGKKYV